ncbi:MAG: hypothetical protein ACKVT0_20995, partial [Planctomycetaceae bacterium]
MNPLTRSSTSKFLALLIGIGTCAGAGTGCARHGHTSIAWKWDRSSSFSDTMSDWLLPFDRLMSQDNTEADSENANAKVTANSAEVSLDEGAVQVAAEESPDAEQTSRLGSFLPWKSDFYRKDAAADSAETVADPFLEMPQNSIAASTETAGDSAEQLATLDEPVRGHGFEALHAPPDESVSSKPPVDDDFDSLIESIDDGNIVVQEETAPPEEERNSALDRLRNMVSEADLLEDIDSSSDTDDDLSTAANDKPQLQIRIEEMLRVAHEMLECGSIDEAHQICLRAKTLADESLEPLNFDDHSPAELLEEIEERRPAEIQQSGNSDADDLTEAESDPSAGVATIVDASNIEDKNIERTKPHGQYLIQRQVDELLLKSRQRLESGLIDDAYRACQHAKSLAKTSEVPLKFSRLSPDELLAQIEERLTESRRDHPADVAEASEERPVKMLSAADFDPDRREVPAKQTRNNSARNEAAERARIQ